MSTAEPPSNGDKAGRKPDATATPDPAAPSTAGATRATADGAGGTSPAAPAKPATAGRKTSSRKRVVPPIAPEGEAPEIMDAALGTGPLPADTSTSPSEPVIAEPAEAPAHPVVPEATMPAPSAVSAQVETAVPTEAPAPAQAATPTKAEAPAQAAPAPAEGAAHPAAPAPSSVEPGPAAATGASAAPTPPSTFEAPPGPPPYAGADAQHPYGRTVNDLADRLDDSRFFTSLFDFTFTSYVTRKLAGPVYVVGLVLIGLGILVGFSNSLTIAIATSSPAGAFVFLLGVLVTLVAAILGVLLLRVAIEVFCAIIEIAQNTRPRRRRPRE